MIRITLIAIPGPNFPGEVFGYRILSVFDKLVEEPWEGHKQGLTIRACHELRRLCDLFAQRCAQKKWTVTTYNGTYLPMKTLHFQDANIARAQDLEDAKSRLEIA